MTDQIRAGIKAEAYRRERSLESGKSAGSVRLLIELRSCCPRTPCGLAACCYCSYRFQECTVAKVMAAFADGARVTFATIIIPDAELRYGRLNAADPRALVARLRMLVRRAGLGDLVAFGVVEVDRREATGIWELHAHLVFSTGDKSRFQRLRSILRRQATSLGIRRPLKLQILPTASDIRRAVNYASKFRPTRKVRIGGKFVKKALRGPRLREILRWMECNPRTFVFAQNLRLHRKCR